MALCVSRRSLTSSVRRLPPFHGRSVTSDADGAVPLTNHLLYDYSEKGKMKFRLIGVGSLLHAGYWVQHKMLLSAAAAASEFDSALATPLSVGSLGAAELIGSLGLTSAVLVIGVGWLYTTRSVARVRYSQGASTLQIETFNLWGGLRPPKMMLVTDIEGNDNSSKSFLQFRPKGAKLYFIVDKKGTFIDKALLSCLIGVGNETVESNPSKIADTQRAREIRRKWARDKSKSRGA